MNIILRLRLFDESDTLEAPIKVFFHVLHRRIRDFCARGDHNEVAVKQLALVLDKSVSLAHKSARAAADYRTADLLARGKSETVYGAVAGVCLDVAMVLAVGEGVDGNILAGRTLTLCVSLLIEMIFFDRCIFHCPCASVEKILNWDFVEITGAADSWNVGARRLFR